MLIYEVKSLLCTTTDLFSKDNWQEQEKRIQNILSAVVKEFLSRHPDANEGVRILNDKLTFFQRRADSRGCCFTKSGFGYCKTVFYRLTCTQIL